MIRARGLRLGLLLSALYAPFAQSGMQSPCDDPSVLGGAAVQVYILPYTAEQTLSPQARALATLMQRHVLFAALKYRSIGVAELTDTGGGCNPVKVVSRIQRQLHQDQVALVLSGRMFEQGDRIYLKSTVLVLADPRQTTLQWPSGASGAAPLTTSTPTLIQSFAPRTIPISYLEQMQAAQSAARRVHTDPTNESPFTDLPDDPDSQFIFYVLDAQNDWMKISVQPYGIKGWVPAHALATGDAMKGEFPELYFIDGLVGLHGIKHDREHAERTARLAVESLQRYLDTTASSGESEPRALAAVLQGNARLLSAGRDWSIDVLRASQADYRRARDILPTSTVAANHDLACTTTLCARGACGDEATQLHQRYLSALTMNPTSIELLDNLATFYAIAIAGKVTTGMDNNALIQQQTMLRQVEAR